ncbi:MAG: hypothetical protein JWM28_1645 [Chitinophagaceae bacterium]|nr:hypothetical protein [Chitinophagaceae bacterium]
MELPAIVNKQEAYLPVKELFDFLKIKNSVSADFDSVSGFFINPKAPYLFDKVNDRIVYQGKMFSLKSTDLIRTETNLYVKSNYFDEVFGLECVFNFRNLSVTLKTKIELPAIREMEQEQMRKNTSKLKGEKKADTTIRQNFPLFNLGIADWSVTTMQATKQKNNTRANLTLGAMIAGGETTVNLNYTSDDPFKRKDQFYKWRYVNNGHSALRQITAGRLFMPSTSTIYAPVTGLQFTNTPTTYRRSFGTYRISNTTEPGWTVELYVNNVMVNYVKADASGFYTFDVPLVYGNSVIKLRIYGPWGEELTKEQNISIPFNFLPARQFEYNVSGGLLDDAQKSVFSRANFNYGLSRRITIGGGTEYLSSVNLGKIMPFINTSIQFNSHLMVSGEYVHGVRSKGTVNYRLPYDIQLDLNYSKYAAGQTAIQFNYLEERKAVLSVPFHGKKFSGFSRLSYNQFIVPKSKYANAEFLVSAVVSGISSNFTTYALFADPAHPYLRSNLSVTFHLPMSLRFTPHIQYEYKQKNFSMIKAEVEKRIGRSSFANVSYEKNIITKASFFTFGLRLNFSFAQTSFSVMRGNQTTTTVQTARGGLLYNGKTHWLGANDQTNVGKGGLIVAAFLDLNRNGRRDLNEPSVPGLKFRINGGRVEQDSKDGSTRVVGLEAYTDYFIELDKNSFDKIAWQILKPTIRVTIEPDHFKMIEVPVTVVGEVSGMIYLKKDNRLNGISRILVNIYDSNHVFVGRTLSEVDGYFSFFGLAPGSFTTSIDTAQLRILNLVSFPKTLSFSIEGNEEGVVADGFEFTMQSLSDSTGQQTGIADKQPAPIQKQQQSVIRKNSPSASENKEQTGIQLKSKKATKKNPDSITDLPSQPDEQHDRQHPAIRKTSPLASKDIKQPNVTGLPSKKVIEKTVDSVSDLRFQPDERKKVQQPAIRKNSTSNAGDKKKPIVIQPTPTKVFDKKFNSAPDLQSPVNEPAQQSVNRKQLIEQFQSIEQKHQYLTQRMKQLIDEQQLLLQQKQQLIREIQQLYLKLKQQNIKKKKSLLKNKTNALHK